MDLGTLERAIEKMALSLLPESPGGALRTGPRREILIETLSDAGVSKAMRQVFVFSKQALFGRDLSGLLHSEAELDALGWETDLDQAIRRIQKIHPPAVIVASEDAATDCGPAVARIQSECPGVQIAEIDLETRVMRIYGGQDEIVQELRDLLSAVERYPRSSR